MLLFLIPDVDAPRVLCDITYEQVGGEMVPVNYLVEDLTLSVFLYRFDVRPQVYTPGDILKQTKHVITQFIYKS